MRFNNEVKHCEFEKTKGAWIGIILFVCVAWGCSPHAGPPWSGTDETVKKASRKSPRARDSVAKVSPKPLERIEPYVVGRALELSGPDQAQALISKLGNETAALLLKARLAELRGDFEGAVSIYHQMTDMVGPFENMRVKAMAEALARAGRPLEAVSQADILLKRDDIDADEKLELRLKQGKWLWKAGEKNQAISAYEDALKQGPRAMDRDKLRLDLAGCYLASNQPEHAIAILTPVALDGESGALMRRAYQLLRKNKILPKWSHNQHLNRAKRLIRFREFNAATKALKLAATHENAQEIEWLEASILFKKRGHYKSAHKAYTEIVKKGGKYSDEARFLAARSLSRMNRDGDAIRGYRAFAAQTKRKGRGHYARFLSGRLEFYLGRHRQALRSFEWLVGSGKDPKGGKLGNAGDRRDAHFMAGLCAVLVGKPKQALAHLEAASHGTSHPEVLKRNRYWYAVAAAMSGGRHTEKAFYEICEEDPTDWYARMSAKRLVALKKPLGACSVDSWSVPEEADGGEVDGGTPLKSFRKGAPDINDIALISPLAGLFATAGLYKDAALFLRKAEKSGVKRTDAVWIRHYISLSAPQHAIRRAAGAFDWPPTTENMEVAFAAYPTPYESVVREVEAKHDLPPDLLFAIARKESLFDPNAVSWVGAMGMMQMMPRTYEANRKKAGLPPLEEGELPGPVPSIEVAGYEFATLFKQFRGSLPLAIMAYNGGAAAVERWVDRSGGFPLDVFVEKVGFGQTRNYVRRVTKNLIRYRLLLNKEVPRLPDIVEKPRVTAWRRVFTSPRRPPI